MESNVKRIYLEGDSYKAYINCDNYFPCGQTQVRRLYKQFILPATNVDPDAMLRDLIAYLKQRIVDLEKETRTLASTYTIEKEARQSLVNKRATTFLSKEQRKIVNADIKFANQECRRIASEINKCVKRSERLKNNGELMEQLIKNGVDEDVERQ